MTSTRRRQMSEMPLSAKLRFVREAWEREKHCRLRYLKGANQNEKVEEANIVLDCLDTIEAHVKGGAV